MAVAVSGCGGDDFENKPRPPVPIELTGVIQAEKLTVSPDNVGAGPLQITISNQTDEAHTVTLESVATGGGSVRERVGPIQPDDTATIQKTLAQGAYEITVGSDQATADEIEPAELSIGPERKSSSDKLLLP